MTELKPCPFCGEPVTLKETYLCYYGYVVEHKTKTESCILSDGKCFDADSYREAARKWNRRAEND